MFKKNNILYIVILSMITLLFIPSFITANSAEPPSILIIVSNPPKDLAISLQAKGGLIDAREIDKVIETYYLFYYRDIKEFPNFTFEISSGDINYNIELQAPVKSYNNIYTLDLDKGLISPGKLLSRSISLVALRVSLTLIIEGIVFWFLGFRKKRSWVTFLIINLITQGALNIWINGFSPMTSYIFLSLIFAEILILIVELFGFSTFVKELHKGDKILYVIVANFLSLVVGGYIISVLPI